MWTDIKKKIYIFFFFFLVKRAGRHFGFFKRAGRHEKGAGRRALQKKPRQNTVHTCILADIVIHTFRQASRQTGYEQTVRMLSET